MKLLALSGWGQPPDALSGIMSEAQTLDYARHGNVRDALQELQGTYDAIIGWSLGGQMAVRAMAAGVLDAKKLVLIAAPYQFVAMPALKLGMPQDVFAMFRAHYATDAGRMLAKSWASILKGDERHAKVRGMLELQDIETLAHLPWLNWLDVLEGFSCDRIDMSRLPPTLLLHGDNDAVVHHAQSQAFMEKLPQAKLVTFTQCGHAPHWHNPAGVTRAIEDFLHG